MLQNPKEKNSVAEVINCQIVAKEAQEEQKEMAAYPHCPIKNYIVSNDDALALTDDGRTVSRLKETASAFQKLHAIKFEERDKDFWLNKQKKRTGIRYLEYNIVHSGCKSHRHPDSVVLRGEIRTEESVRSLGAKRCALILWQKIMNDVSLKGHIQGCCEIVEDYLSKIKAYKARNTAIFLEVHPLLLGYNGGTTVEARMCDITNLPANPTRVCADGEGTNSSSGFVSPILMCFSIDFAKPDGGFGSHEMAFLFENEKDKKQTLKMAVEYAREKNTMICTWGGDEETEFLKASGEEARAVVNDLQVHYGRKSLVDAFNDCLSKHNPSAPRARKNKRALAYWSDGHIEYALDPIFPIEMEDRYSQQRRSLTGTVHLCLCLADCRAISFVARHNGKKGKESK